MGVKAGSVLHTGGSSFSVAVGFRPRWGIFMASNIDSEGAWDATNVTGALGFAAVQNSAEEENNLHAAGYHEIWDSTLLTVGGVWLGNQSIYVQNSADAPVDGWTAFITFTATGFDVFSSITGGAAGKRIYYLLGDQDWEEVASSAGFIPGVNGPLNLGWQPQAVFGIGAGGGTGNADYNTGFTDLSLAAVIAGDWGEYTTFDREFISIHRAISDPNPNIQHWYGSKIEGRTVIPEPTITGGVYFTADFVPDRTDTEFIGDVIPNPGFGDDDARLKAFILGSVDSIVGSFVPDTSGAEVQVALPFTPEAVFLASPMEDRSGVSSQAVQGATGWGWCTEDDQALVAFGGHWNPPNPFQAAGYMSSSLCWMANCLDRETMGTVGTKVTAGSAYINDAGFVYQTQMHAADAGEVWPIYYWAFAPVSGLPQFFRIL